MKRENTSPHQGHSQTLPEGLGLDPNRRNTEEITVGWPERDHSEG